MALPPRPPKGSPASSEDEAFRKNEQEMLRDRLLSEAEGAGIDLPRLQEMFRAADVKGGLEEQRRRQIAQGVVGLQKLLADHAGYHRALHEELEPEHGPCPLVSPETVEDATLAQSCNGQHPAITLHVKVMAALGFQQVGLQAQHELMYQPRRLAQAGAPVPDSWPMVVARLSTVFRRESEIETYRDIAFLRMALRPDAQLPFLAEALANATSAAKQAHYSLSVPPRRRQKSPDAHA